MKNHNESEDSVFFTGSYKSNDPLFGGSGQSSLDVGSKAFIEDISVIDINNAPDAFDEALISDDEKDGAFESWPASGNQQAKQNKNKPTKQLTRHASSVQTMTDAQPHQSRRVVSVVFILIFVFVAISFFVTNMDDVTERNHYRSLSNGETSYWFFDSLQSGTASDDLANDDDLRQQVKQAARESIPTIEAYLSSFDMSEIEGRLREELDSLIEEKVLSNADLDYPRMATWLLGDMHADYSFIDVIEFLTKNDSSNNGSTLVATVYYRVETNSFGDYLSDFIFDTTITYDSSDEEIKARGKQLKESIDTCLSRGDGKSTFYISCEFEQLEDGSWLFVEDSISESTEDVIYHLIWG